MSDWRLGESMPAQTPSCWRVKLSSNETFAQGLVRCFTIEELEVARDVLNTLLLKRGRILRRDIYGALYWIIVAAQDYLPGVLAGRSIHKIDWGYSDNRYINAKWQYRMVYDAICDAIELMQKKN